MNFSFIKSVVKVKALVVIFFIIGSVNASAFFWNSKITILCYGEKSVTDMYIYELKDGEIYETIIMPKKITKSGKDILIDLTKLDDCTIKDSKNWKCGGKTTYGANGSYRSEMHAVYEWQYTYFPDSSSYDNCVKRVQSN